MISPLSLTILPKVAVKPPALAVGRSQISGDTEKQLSVSDVNWKRLGQIPANKIQLIRRSNGLIISI